MPKAFAWILAAVTVLVLALFGLAIAIALTRQEPPSGSLDTDLEGVTVSAETTTEPEPEPPPEPAGDRAMLAYLRRRPQALPRAPRCDPGAAGAEVHVGARRSAATSSSRPSTATGELYVNTFSGTTFAIDADTGKIRWTRRVGGTLPSSPAIDGPRVLVASQDGTVTALSRRSGRSALAGAHRRQGRVLAGRRRRARGTSARTTAGSSRFGRDTGRVRWAYQTGGRINASPAVFGGNASASRRMPARSSASIARRARSDGRRTSSATRSATRASTPARRRDGDADLQRRALRQGRCARRLERTHRLDGRRRRARLHDARGRRRPRVRRRLRRPRCARSARRRATSSGAARSTVASSARPSSSGPYVFFSTLEKHTYALRVSDGAIAWRLPLGKYAPGIATERHLLLLAERPSHRVPGRDAPNDVRLTGAGGDAARAAIAAPPTRRRSRPRGARRTRRARSSAVRRGPAPELDLVAEVAREGLPRRRRTRRRRPRTCPRASSALRSSAASGAAAGAAWRRRRRDPV